MYDKHGELPQFDSYRVSNTTSGLSTGGTRGDDPTRRPDLRRCGAGGAFDDPPAKLARRVCVPTAHSPQDEGNVRIRVIKFPFRVELALIGQGGVFATVGESGHTRARFECVRI